MRKLLQSILKILSKAVIRKYNPLIIGITGSVGKTSTKEAVFAVLKNKFNVRANDASFNNEIGFPMAILGIKKPGRLIWISNILKSFGLIFSKSKRYPEILVLEMGADKPGDLDYLINIAKPKVGLVTAIGELPVHVEFYSGPEEVVEEKSKLIQALPSDGFAVLNHDDEIVLRMKDLSRAETITFGFNQGAVLQASDVSYFVDSNSNIGGGLSFKVNFEKSIVPFRLINALGRHQIYAALAAAAIGLHLGMNLVEISQALEKLEFPKQRMRLIKGIKKSLIIDDSYNASPLSTHAALDALKEFGDKVIAKTGVGRKIAVLGDMKELGIFTERAHRLIGNLAGERADYLFTVGPAAKFIADSAFNQLSKENIMSFNDADEAKEAIRAFILEGDIILVKGSRAMELEKIVEVLAIP
ncbi:MAG: Mur ligase family protein [Patescibacteria group bacterium]